MHTRSEDTLRAGGGGHMTLRKTQYVLGSRACCNMMLSFFVRLQNKTRAHCGSGLCKNEKGCVSCYCLNQGYGIFFFFLGRISYIFLSHTRFIYLSVCFVFQSCCLSPANLHTACGHNFSETAATEPLGTVLDLKLRSDCESYVPTSY